MLARGEIGETGLQRAIDGIVETMLMDKVSTPPIRLEHAMGPWIGSRQVVLINIPHVNEQGKAILLWQECDASNACTSADLEVRLGI